MFHQRNTDALTVTSRDRGSTKAKDRLLRSISVLFALALITGDASAGGLRIELDGTIFPKQVHYPTLNENIADLVSPCRDEDTSGSRDYELLEAFRGARRQLADAILDHIVDDEFIPTQQRDPKRDRYRSRTVTIDPFSYGVTDLQLDTIPDGLTAKVTLAYHLGITISHASSDHRAEYNVTIWRWNKPDERSKSCMFSYHR